MKNLFFFFVLLLLLSSCGASKVRRHRNTNRVLHNSSKVHLKKNENHVSKSSSYKYEPVSEATKVADNALKFQGTKYKWGGTSRKGMDCSGLVYKAFQEENISLPRVSRAMAKKGRRLQVDEINVGDLLFFETDKNRKRINHVGLVVKIVPGQVSFIHSTTHHGVIVSSLNEKYWNQRFVLAKRVF